MSIKLRTIVGLYTIYKFQCGFVSFYCPNDGYMTRLNKVPVVNFRVVMRITLAHMQAFTKVKERGCE